MEVTKRYPDGFPAEIRQSTFIEGQRVGWGISRFLDRRTDPLDDAIFRVSPAAGSFISRNDEGWIYSVGQDGSRTKYAPIATGKPVGFLDRAGVFLVGGAGAALTGGLLLAYRRTNRRVASPLALVGRAPPKRAS